MQHRNNQNIHVRTLYQYIRAFTQLVSNDEDIKALISASDLKVHFQHLAGFLGGLREGISPRALAKNPDLGC